MASEVKMLLQELLLMIWVAIPIPFIFNVFEFLPSTFAPGIESCSTLIFCHLVHVCQSGLGIVFFLVKGESFFKVSTGKEIIKCQEHYM